MSFVQFTIRREVCHTVDSMSRVNALTPSVLADTFVRQKLFVGLLHKLHRSTWHVFRHGDGGERLAVFFAARQSRSFVKGSNSM